MPTRTPPTKSSTPKLSDVARHLVAPKGAVKSGWPAVETKVRSLGIQFRWWQRPIGRLILAKRADGTYASTIGGTGLSIPRQVGKTFLVGAIVFALCLLRPKLTVLWTAHRVRTAEETFGKMQAFARRKRIAPFVEKVVLGSGEEEILFRNGSRILFGARESGFGLGFDEVDVLIFDEAQRLRDSTLDDMVPATNQSRQPEGALLLFMGTPPRPTDAGEVFTRMRREALSGEDEDTGWVEFGCDPDYEFTPLPAPLTDADWAQIAKANPSFPADTPKVSILRMRKKLGPDSFDREGAGRWDEDEEADRPIRSTAWAKCVNKKAKRPDRAIVYLEVAHDRSQSSIGIAAAGSKRKRTLVMKVTKPGTAWVVPRVEQLVEQRDIAAVVLHPRQAKAVLGPDLASAGVEFETATLAELGQACSKFISLVDRGRIEHVGQSGLDAEVERATTKKLRGVEQWDPDAVDLTALGAVSGAAYRWALEGDYDIEDSYL